MTALRNIWAIFLREIGSYFLSPIAYVVIFLFTLSNGYMFWLVSDVSGGRPPQAGDVVEALFGFALVWVLPLSPLLTMRLFAEEKRSGSLELLMTAPVTELEAVAGKFLAAQVFYSIIWLSMLPLFILLDILGRLDWGPILAIYAGIFSLGLLTNGLGVLASSLGRNQLVAAAVALTGNLLFFLVSQGQALFPDDPDMRRLFQYAGFTSHFGSDYNRGIIDLRYLVFYLSFCAIFLFFSVRLVEARKWR